MLFKKVGDAASDSLPVTAWPTKFKIIVGGIDGLGYSGIHFFLPNGVQMPILTFDPLVDYTFPRNSTDPPMKIGSTGMK